MSLVIPTEMDTRMKKRVPQPSYDSLNLTTVLTALADPVRRHLLCALFDEGKPMECRVAAQQLSLTAATLSHHWRTLREAGLTTTTVQGRSRFIELRKAEVDAKFPGLLDAVLQAQETTQQVKEDISI